MNESIYFLMEYNWELATLVSEGKKNFKIFVSGVWMTDHTRYVPKEKCARPDESVCVVWEMWKGKNGRGGYRVERTLYPEHRVRADHVAHQSWGPGRVNEDSYGVLQSGQNSNNPFLDPFLDPDDEM